MMKKTAAAIFIGLLVLSLAGCAWNIQDRTADMGRSQASFKERDAPQDGTQRQGSEQSRQPQASFQEPAGDGRQPGGISPEKAQEEEGTYRLQIIIGDQSFSAKLYENETARALIETFPVTLEMSEMNGNEKYYYFSQEFPANPSVPEKINAGDLMLYGGDCLVLFYESFTTSYSYTPVGYLEDPTGLAQAVGNAEIQVSFQTG